MTRDAERARMKVVHGEENPWRRWGPYVSERQWGTVREDYSEGGDAWAYFPHDHARSRTYRWGEDGIAGVCDEKQRVCLALALWNGRDPILKERLFGLTNAEGNHGEDVKEIYYYLDALPSHSYLKMLYKYPQGEFPYDHLVAENHRRGKNDPEFELLDTGIFDEHRYFDVFVEYAKAGPDDILMRVTAHNRGPDAADLHILPHVWFRNTWSWSVDAEKPTLTQTSRGEITVKHPALGEYAVSIDGAPTLLFCDNETNARKLFETEESPPFPKDVFHDYIVAGKTDAVNPRHEGTKAAAHFLVTIASGGSTTVRLRFAKTRSTEPFGEFDEVFADRQREADEYYADLQADVHHADAKLVQRQAFAGMIWSKQFYDYDVNIWLKGDPTQPAPPKERRHGRNNEWLHVNNADIISMPDKWEYPWYAAWDLAFHCIPLALLDAEFAKGQLVLLTREWYMHPNGQLPAYEWKFDDVNPPVHAWAAWRVFQIDRKHRGGCGDLEFLERVFHKLMLNFTWWVNRKDADGRNIFQGGFLGLDNIGVFDRSAPLPTGGYINQADGTAWMAMYCLNLMRIALELAIHNHVYEDIATKFFEHFLGIAEAMTKIGQNEHAGVGLWDEEDEFYYDELNLPDGSMHRLKIRSIVGLIPLFAVETLEPELLHRVPQFALRLNYYLKTRPDLCKLVSRWHEPGRGERRLLSLLRGHRMKMLLCRMLDETEFLSDFGVRALSKAHEKHPYEFRSGGKVNRVDYEPAESRSNLFGGNSNWRGPIWFPVNYLIIESLQKFHHYYGDDFKVECPTGSGTFMTIHEVSEELTRRLARIFLRDADGRRAVFGDDERLQADPHFKDYVPFYEYFHGDTGRGVGASHQTGWTGLIAKLFRPRRKELPEEHKHRVASRPIEPLIR
jgi:hypothetical protein